MPEIDGSERGDRIDEEQRGMPRAIHGSAHLGHAGCDAGGRFVLHDTDGFDRVAAIFSEPCFDDLPIHAVTPVALRHFDIEAKL